MPTASEPSSAASLAAALAPAVRAEYPFASHTLQVAGGRMHYIDESPATAVWSAARKAEGEYTSTGGGHAAGIGSGGAPAVAGASDEVASLPPVLMLHGNPTWSFFYRNVVKALVAQGRRCIVPDHIGCGLSDKPQIGFGYTLEENIANVIALVEHLGLKQFDLIVHDWGGAIGMGVAMRLPQQVRRIVILNTAAFRSQDIPARIALCRVPLLGQVLVQGFNGFAWPATFMAVSRKPLPRAVKQGFLFPYNSWRNRIATHRFVKAIPLAPDHENYPTLKAIEERLPALAPCPKLLLWGGKDFCFNDRFYNRWREIYPDATPHYIADAGHYLLEDAQEETLREICAFLGQ